MLVELHCRCGSLSRVDDGTAESVHCATCKRRTKLIQPSRRAPSDTLDTLDTLCIRIIPNQVWWMFKIGMAVIACFFGILAISFLLGDELGIPPLVSWYLPALAVAGFVFYLWIKHELIEKKRPPQGTVLLLRSEANDDAIPIWQEFRLGGTEPWDFDSDRHPFEFMIVSAFGSSNLEVRKILSLKESAEGYDRGYHAFRARNVEDFWYTEQIEADLEDWKQIIIGEMDRCSYVVIIPGPTPGVLWEQKAALCDPAVREKTLFILPPHRTIEAPERWEMLRSVAREAGCELASLSEERTCDPLVVSFGSGWNALIVACEPKGFTQFPCRGYATFQKAVEVAQRWIDEPSGA